jgi:hypothetical protein
MKKKSFGTKCKKLIKEALKLKKIEKKLLGLKILKTHLNYSKKKNCWGLCSMKKKTHDTITIYNNLVSEQ